MSYGIVICSKCKREVHQDGSEHSWRHCEDKTAICQNAEDCWRAGEVCPSGMRDGT